MGSLLVILIDDSVNAHGPAELSPYCTVKFLIVSQKLTSFSNAGQGTH